MLDKKFIYALDQESMEELIELGYTFVGCDNEKQMWAFVNDNDKTMAFSVSSDKFVFSDTLTL